jgi:hypothetical protein
MGALEQTRANNILDAVLGTASFTAITTPIKCRLMTVNGTSTAAGTELTGGSYTPQTVTFSAAAAGTTASTVAATFAGMPAATIVGVEIYDSSGTPKRLFWGALAASKTTNAGDTLTIASGALSLAFT